jgi:integrase/recombinase XerD
MDVVVVINEFKNQLKARGYAESTITNYSRFLGYFRDHLVDLGITDIKKINHKVIRDYQERIMAKNLAMETQGLFIRPVKRLFSYLIETHRLLIDPTEGIIEVTRKGRKMSPVLTIDEVQKLLEQPNLSYLVQVRDRAIMETFYSTGMRLDELLSLQVYDVDFKGKVIFIRKGKGGRQRAVPLGTNTAMYLKEYLTKIRPKYTKSNPTEQRIFLANNGKALSALSVRGFLRVYRIKAGIEKNVSPHTFRRTCATHLLQQGADIRHIQELLGHKNLKTTQFYTKVSSSEVKKTHEKTHPGIEQ